MAIACMYAYGAEDVTQLPPPLPAKPTLPRAQQLDAGSGGQNLETSNSHGGLQAAPHPLGSSKAPAAKMRAITAFTISLALWLMLLMLLSDAVLPPDQRVQWLHLGHHLLHQGRQVLAGGSAASSRSFTRSGSSSGDGQGWSFWPLHAYRRHFAFEDVSPNLGQWWYVFMEMFDDSRVRHLANCIVHFCAGICCMASSTS